MSLASADGRVAMPLGRRNDPGSLLEPALKGDRTSLARLLSLVEHGGDGAREIGRLTYPRAGHGYTVGITGAPGSGKSTLTDGLITEARGRDCVAVLAVDPSSPFSGGAILGDRVRMQGHAGDDGVFIRSMATRGHLGGLSLAVPEAIRVLDAVGFGVILVETVGVGQVEVEVAGSADTTMVVVNPGWGDSIQANKAGLLEIADILVVNKSDRPGAQETRRDLEFMLEMSQLKGWRPPIVLSSATAGEGVSDLWAEVQRHRAHLEEVGQLAERRAARLDEELRRIVLHRLEERAGTQREGGRFEEVRQALLGRQIDPYEAADLLIEDSDHP